MSCHQLSFSAKKREGNLKLESQWNPPIHCALGAILDLLYKSKTSGGKVMKFTPSYTFTKRNILVKKFWPLKARKAMLK